MSVMGARGFDERTKQSIGDAFVAACFRALRDRDMASHPGSSNMLLVEVLREGVIRAIEKAAMPCGRAEGES